MNAEDLSRAITAIVENRDSGATCLAAEAAQLLGTMASDLTTSDGAFAELFPHAAQQIALARPSVAPLLNCAGAMFGAWRQAGGESSPTHARRAVAETANRWLATQREATSLIADHAARILAGTVITLSYSSTVMACLKAMWEKDRLSGIVVAESRPLCEGRRTATELAGAGIPVALITDAQMGVFVSMANAAVVGADTIMTGGAVVNKAGTLLLTLVARRARVPVYALSGTQKIAPAPGHHRRMPFSIEEHEPGEVLAEPIPGVAVRNSYFDLTPGHFFTGYITEEGLLTRREVTDRARRAPGSVFLNLKK